MRLKNSSLIIIIFMLWLVACSTEAEPTTEPSGTAVAQPQTANPTPDLPFEMRPFTTPDYGYVLDIPADWEDVAGVDRRCQNAPACFLSDDDHILIIGESQIGDVGGQGMTLSEYIDLILPTFGDGGTGYEFVSREQVPNNIGQDSEVITYTLNDGEIKAKSFWFAIDGQALNVYYMGYAEDYQEIETAVQYSFESLRKQ